MDILKYKKKSSLLIKKYKEEQKLYAETEDMKYLIASTSTLNEFLALVASRKTK